VVFMVKRYNDGNDTTEAFHGLSRTNPTVALVMAIAMLSLAGIPATAGFFGKFYVFSSAVKSGMLWLVAVAVVNSFIGAYYYLRPVVGAYFEKGTSATLLDGGVPRWLLILLAVLTVLVGVAPSVLADVL
jgi:NADH-quinone oxidoreductase subunit N